MGVTKSSTGQGDTKSSGHDDMTSTGQGDVVRVGNSTDNDHDNDNDNGPSDEGKGEVKSGGQDRGSGESRGRVRGDKGKGGKGEDDWMVVFRARSEEGGCHTVKEEENEENNLVEGGEGSGDGLLGESAEKGKGETVIGVEPVTGENDKEEKVIGENDKGKDEKGGNDKGGKDKEENVKRGNAKRRNVKGGKQWLLCVCPPEFPHQLKVAFIPDNNAADTEGGDMNGGSSGSALAVTTTISNSNNNNSSSSNNNNSPSKDSNSNKAIISKTAPLHVTPFPVTLTWSRPLPITPTTPLSITTTPRGQLNARVDTTTMLPTHPLLALKGSDREIMRGVTRDLLYYYEDEKKTVGTSALTIASTSISALAIASTSSPSSAAVAVAVAARAKAVQAPSSSSSSAASAASARVIAASSPKAMVRMTSVGDDDHVGSKNNNNNNNNNNNINNNNTTPNKSTPTNPPSRPLIPGCTFPTPGGYFLTCHFDPIALRQNNPTLGTHLLLPTPLFLICIPLSDIFPLPLISTPYL